MKNGSEWEKVSEVLSDTSWMDKYGLNDEELGLAKFLKKEGI